MREKDSEQQYVSRDLRYALIIGAIAGIVSVILNIAINRPRPQCALVSSLVAERAKVRAKGFDNGVFSLTTFYMSPVLKRLGKP